MKFSASFVGLLMVAGTAHAFTSPAVSSKMGGLKMSEAPVAEAEVEEQVQAPDAPPAALSGLRMHEVRRAVHSLNKENFETTLADLEPYFLNEAGSSLYAKSMRRISARADALGVEVPAGYAKEAKVTQKRREKQNAFIQTKEEERMAAEAEAEAEAADATEEEAAPVEE
ncbi:expressed unknown protein [Seminavis robusta]|uniref:Uncharacterized protein n=1 Tax=Seminavis robusta TaxID=568900 RepID=A0A9N8D7V9_9STRA|nr:expressed unknown protein [Seminavis robusta]|eukprot:Sro10_g008080.1 n/a (170) ;mRNA; f:110237-110746